MVQDQISQGIALGDPNNQENEFQQAQFIELIKREYNKKRLGCSWSEYLTCMNAFIDPWYSWLLN
jgi:hypothetical protein